MESDLTCSTSMPHGRNRDAGILRRRSRVQGLAFPVLVLHVPFDFDHLADVVLDVAIAVEAVEITVHRAQDVIVLGAGQAAAVGIVAERGLHDDEAGPAALP